ncbi:hypothetical protein [Frateuria defendens]|uniref:hypothetical protein n=1 Tax=Frateuria defendens TaxID=2219559 RepID=UPI001293C2A3|nr:hypothetical protein [Frateuria defendens]
MQLDKFPTIQQIDFFIGHPLAPIKGSGFPEPNQKNPRHAGSFVSGLCAGQECVPAAAGTRWGRAAAGALRMNAGEYLKEDAMPTERTAAQLLAELVETRMERDRFRLENELLRGQLLRHASGVLQLREVARRVKGSAMSSGVSDDD